MRRIRAHDSWDGDVRTWPATVPAVRQVLTEGLDLAPGVTFLVGENGAGKSTLVEAVAMAYGLSPEGGTPYGRHQTHETESGLHRLITLERTPGASRWGFFLRAETMHGWYTFVEGGSSRDPEFHRMSHGESFLAVLRTRFDSPGLYVLDEPEAALSFSSQIALVGALHDVALSGGQVLCATHSPLLLALPGATLLEVGEDGIVATQYADVAMVAHWKAYLADPMRYLRHVLD